MLCFCKNIRQVEDAIIVSEHDGQASSRLRRDGITSVLEYSMHARRTCFNVQEDRKLKHWS